MRSFTKSSCSFTLASALLFTAQLLVTLVLLSTSAAAQQAASRPTPPPAVFQNLIPIEKLAFLADYAGRDISELKADTRFIELMNHVTPDTVFHYCGSDMPLIHASELALSGARLPIGVREGRYVMAASPSNPCKSARGFVWFDMKEGIVLGGVYFHPVNGEPTPTLTVFTRQLKQKSLSMCQLPEAFEQDVNRWALAANGPVVTARYFIPDDGKKYVLVHDENYCAPSENALQWGPPACKAIQSDAASIDSKAEEFIKASHHAANAMWGRNTLNQAVSLKGFQPGSQIGSTGTNSTPGRIQSIQRSNPATGNGHGR